MSVEYGEEVNMIERIQMSQNSGGWPKRSSFINSNTTDYFGQIMELVFEGKQVTDKCKAVQYYIIMGLSKTH